MHLPFLLVILRLLFKEEESRHKWLANVGAMYVRDLGRGQAGGSRAWFESCGLCRHSEVLQLLGGSVRDLATP